MANVGAITRSSGYLVRSVADKLPVNLSTIVEYGAGDGVMTRILLEHLAPTGRLIAIEANDAFIDELKK